MMYSKEVEEMCVLAKGPNHGPAPIPAEGKWVQSKEVTDISGLTHGIGWCAPQQGACKLTLNVKDGIIEEALVETIGCSGMTHSAATMYGTLAKGPRYLEMAEGYVTEVAVDEDKEIIGYKFVNLGKMMESIAKGVDANEALEAARGQYGRVDDAAQLLDPRHN